MKKIIFICFFSALLVGIQAQTPWYLTGNGSIDTTLNFIGTTNKKPLIFKTRDTERMKLLSDKSFLGIGTSTPLATLHLHYQTDGQPVSPLKLLQLTTPVTGFGPNDGFSVIYEFTNDIYFKQHEDANIFIEGPKGGMTITQDGKIGMGTDAPEEKLHIDDGNLLITGMNSGNGALIFADLINNIYPYGKCRIEYQNSVHPNQAGLNFGVYNYTDPPGLSTLLFLSNNERVGIGNVNPQTKLDVSGSFRAQSANIDNTIIADEISANIATINKNLSTDDFVANTATIANTLSAGAFAANSAVISGAFGSNSATISGALSANTATISGALNANSATVSGTLATNKLRVADLLCAKEIKVNLTPCWPDYVFKKNYNLMPLQELEQFVNKNHHLPEIPSAATVEENGIELGEMNAKFLKKIEELTLYIIDLQKQIDELKNK